MYLNKITFHSSKFQWMHNELFILYTSIPFQPRNQPNEPILRFYSSLSIQKFKKPCAIHQAVSPPSECFGHAIKINIQYLLMDQTETIWSINSMLTQRAIPFSLIFPGSIFPFSCGIETGPFAYLTNADWSVFMTSHLHTFGPLLCKPLLSIYLFHVF